MIEVSAEILPRPCSIERSLALLGQRWVMLVVRELVFGTSRFDAIAAATGAARNLLTDRLRALEESGLVERRAYSEHPPRYDYLLTGLGHEAAEVLLPLLRFGDRHLSATPPVVWHHAPAGGEESAHVLDVALVCRTCGRPASEGMVDPVGPGAPSRG